MADINKSSESVTYKYVVVAWQKIDGELFESVQAECLPLTKTGLKLLEKKVGGTALFMGKDEKTKESQLWEGLIEGLFGNFFVLLLLPDTEI